VALVRSSYVNFLNVDNFTMGDTLSVAMASSMRVFIGDNEDRRKKSLMAFTD